MLILGFANKRVKVELLTFPVAQIDKINLCALQHDHGDSLLATICLGQRCCI